QSNVIDFFGNKVFVRFSSAAYGSRLERCAIQAASMTASDTPSLVLRNTSLTMRELFTPARSCSTLTRICANFRLLRFSASVSSPRGGFFFRLASFQIGRAHV